MSDINRVWRMVSLATRAIPLTDCCSGARSRCVYGRGAGRCSARRRRSAAYRASTWLTKQSSCKKRGSSARTTQRNVALSASEIRGVPNRFAYAKLTMMVPARGARTRSRDYMQETYAGPVRQRTFSLYLYAHGHLWCLCEYGQQARCLCEYGQHTCVSCGCVRCYFAELLFVPPFTAAPREVLLTRHERALRHERAPAGRVQPRDGRGWDNGHRVL